jgi:peroxiredoxin
MRNVENLPNNLPIPQDDGLTNHLSGYTVPHVLLPSTSGRLVDLAKVSCSPTVVFIYPRAGSPIAPNKNVEAWDLIPGARGCTPHTCGYRDLYKDFTDLGVAVFGLSVQASDIQKEFVQRMHIPFEILSDEEHKLMGALHLPTFEFEDELLIKRMAFFLNESKIQKVFYPIFPPDKNASEVLEWLKGNQHEY